MMPPPPSPEVRRQIEAAVQPWMTSKQSWENYARRLEELLDEAKDLLQGAQDQGRQGEISAFLEKLKKKS